MKNVVLFLLCATVFLSCQNEEEISTSIGQENDKAEFVISDEELNQVLQEKYGHTNFSFDEKSKVVTEYLLEKQGILVDEVVHASNERMEEYNRVSITAGMYKSGEWYDVIKFGSISSYLQVGKIEFLPAHGIYGASASIYRCVDNHCYLYDIKTDLPAQFSCVGSTVKARASSHWNAGVSYNTSTYVICKNDD